MWGWLIRKTNTAIFLPRLQDHSLRIHKALLISADPINAEDTGLYLLCTSCRKGFCVRGLWLQFRCPAFPSRRILQWNNSIIKSLQCISICFISSVRISLFFFCMCVCVRLWRNSKPIVAVLDFYETSYLGNREKISGEVEQHKLSMQNGNAIPCQCELKAEQISVCQQVPLWACLYANTNSVWHKLYELCYLTSKYFPSSVCFQTYLIYAFLSILCVLLTAEAGVLALLLFRPKMLLDMSMDRKNTSPGGPRCEKQMVWQVHTRHPTQALQITNYFIAGGILSLSTDLAILSGFLWHHLNAVA